MGVTQGYEKYGKMDRHTVGTFPCCIFFAFYIVDLDADM